MPSEGIAAASELVAVTSGDYYDSRLFVGAFTRKPAPLSSSLTARDVFSTATLSMQFFRGASF
jgi:hypothetical protein